MRILATLAMILTGSAVSAEFVTPSRTIRARELITAADLAVAPGEASGAHGVAAEVIGREARVTLYPGRAIRIGDVIAPAVVDRNDLVTLVFARSSLTITAEGRALGRGAAGDLIRVMNLASKATMAGRIRTDGSIEIE